MATYSGILKKWNQTGTVWDILYPKTTGENIISGTVALARIPTMDAAHIPTLDAAKIGTGTIDVARLPAIAITNTVVYTTLATFVTAYQGNHNLVQEGDVVILTTDKKTYIHNGGTAYTSADLTLLQTPTDLVTSVQGKTGVVTLDGGDLGISLAGNYYGDQDPIAAALAAVDTQVYANVSAIGGKEPAFSKNTGFNKNFGTAAGTVAQGDDSRFMSYVDRSNGKFGIALQDCFEMTGQTTKVHNDAGLVMEINAGGTTHDMVTRRLVNVVDPTGAQDAATKNYIDTHQLMLSDSLPTTGLVDGQIGFEY